MICLTHTLSAWNTPDFAATLKREVTEIGASHLPLQQGLSSSNYVADAPLTVVIHRVTEMEDVIRVQAGIFYSGVLGGCSCADDPTPNSEINEYCVVQLDIDKATAATAVTLISE